MNNRWISTLRDRLSTVDFAGECRPLARADLCVQDERSRKGEGTDRECVPAVIEHLGEANSFDSVHWRPARTNVLRRCSISNRWTRASSCIDGSPL